MPVMSHFLAAVRLTLKARRDGYVTAADCHAVPPLSRPAGAFAGRAIDHWANEVEKKQPSLWAVLRTCCQFKFLIGVVCVFSRGCGVILVLPLLVNLIVKALAAGDVTGAGRLFALLIAERVVGAVLEVVGFTMLQVAATEWTAALQSLLVDKICHTPGIEGLAQAAGLNPQALFGRELAGAHLKLSFMLGPVMQAIPFFFVGGFTLIYLLGPAGVCGMVWILMLIRLNLGLMIRSRDADERVSIAAGNRMGITTNVISAMKAIKLFTWENEFLDRLNRTRANECKELRTKIQWTNACMCAAKLTPVTGSLVTFLLYAFLGNELHASEIFAANSVFMMIRISVGTAGFFFDLAKTSQLVVSRCRQFLLLTPPPARALVDEAGEDLATTDNLSVAFEGFKLSAGSRVLARPGRLTAVVGLVGSGKSALLSALLGVGEGAVEGKARTTSTVGWAQQRTTLLATSVKENIVLGRRDDDEELAHALTDACLDVDLDNLPQGLDEPVGERGTTLSGGQQARIGLARAYYASPRLLVLDDPLAAVDAQVGLALFHRLRERCQRTGAGALVVLNQVGLVSQGFDDVIVLKDGAVVCDGPVADVEQDPHFRAVAEAIPQVDVAASAEAQMAQRTKAMHRSTILISAAAGARATRSAVPVASDEKQGFVSSRVWKTYVLAAGVGPCAAVLLVYFLMYSSLAIRDWWLSVWSDAEDAEDNIGFYAGVFSAISFFNIATTLTLIFLVSFAAERAGRSLHEKAVKSLLRAPVGYFETTPLGAITSRLGADLAMVDGGFSMTLDLLLTFVLMVSTLCVAVVLNLPAMAVIFLVVIFASLKVLYGAGVLRIDAKRVSNSDMAPMLSSVQNAVTGAPIARVLDVTGFFIQRTRDHLELWAKSTDLSNIIAQVTTAWCCTMHLVVLFATYVLIRLAQWQGEGLLALCFSYATIWGQWMQLTVNVTLQTLMMGTSLERLLSYIDGELPQEAEWRTDADPSQWPARGAVTFENVAVRYAADKPLVLRGLTLSVNAEERLAVVGRTGAGKSTILTALFRLVEVHSGTIRFDGVDIATLGVHTLRQAVSMIPQEPIVMDGTVRYNLDPFDQESDEKLEAALAKVGLSIALATAAAGAGTGLSAGQKQLVTLARALLQRSHLVVMDEPTSSVDQQTDRQVQQVVRSELRGRTLICIAHRLETVRDYDRLAVIGDGQLLEVGEPGGLLAAPDSAAAQLFSAHEADGTARPAEAETGSRAREGEL